jgi:hypothetical protein
MRPIDESADARTDSADVALMGGRYRRCRPCLSFPEGKGYLALPFLKPTLALGAALLKPTLALGAALEMTVVANTNAVAITIVLILIIGASFQWAPSISRAR